MKLKRIMAVVFLVALTGCSVKTGTDAPASVPAPPTSEAIEAAPAETPTARAIVFDSAINDPISAKMLAEDNRDDAKAALKLTFYETAPSVYGGGGTLERSVSYQSGEHKVISAIVYRLGFNNMRPGDASETEAIARCDYREQLPVQGTPELGSFSYSKRFASREDIGCALAFDGGDARMSLTLYGTEFVFYGKAIEVPMSGNTPDLPGNGNCVYINSSWLAGSKEYRAVLTAKQDVGGSWTGGSCLYGTGNTIEFTDGDVSFDLLPFEREAYEAAGGKLPGTFGAYGIARGPGGDFFVLMDGAVPLLEPIGSGMAFFGELLPEDRYAGAKHEAEETKQLMKTLFDGAGGAPGMNGLPENIQGKDFTDPAVQNELREYMESMMSMAKPAWYPDSLMPEPIRLLDEWTELTPPAGMLFRVYSAQYTEDILLASEVYENYKRQLSSREGFEARATEFVPADHKGEAVIIFRKGAYRIMVNIFQQVLCTGVLIYIYG